MSAAGERAPGAGGRLKRCQGRPRPEGPGPRAAPATRRRLPNPAARVTVHARCAAALSTRRARLGCLPLSPMLRSAGGCGLDETKQDRDALATQRRERAHPAPPRAPVRARRAPVEMCDIFSARPAFSTAATESPPPMMVMAPCTPTRAHAPHKLGGGFARCAAANGAPSRAEKMVVVVKCA